MHALKKNRAHFTENHPLELFLGVLETFEYVTTFVFEIVEKTFFSKKLEPKTFLSIFFITPFIHNVFTNIFTQLGWSEIQVLLVFCFVLRGLVAPEMDFRQIDFIFKRFRTCRYG